MTTTLAAPPACNCTADAARDHLFTCPFEQWMRAADKAAYLALRDVTPIPDRQSPNGERAHAAAMSGNWSYGLYLLRYVTDRSEAFAELARTLADISAAPDRGRLNALSGWAMAVFHGHHVEDRDEMSVIGRQDNVARDWYAHAGYVTALTAPEIAAGYADWDSGTAHPQDALAAYLATDLNNLPTERP